MEDYPLPGRILGLTIVIVNPSVCPPHAFIVTSPLDGFSSYLAYRWTLVRDASCQIGSHISTSDLEIL